MPPLSSSTKKLILGVLGLAIVLGAAVAFYAVYFRSRITPLSAPTTKTIGGGLPNAGKAKPGTGSTVAGGSLPSSGTTSQGSAQGTQTSPPTAAASPSRTQSYVDLQTSFVSLDPTAGKNGLRFYNSADGKFYRTDEFGTLTPISDKAFYNVQTVSWGKQTDKAILEYPDGSNIYYDFTKDQQVTLPKFWQNFDFAPNDQKIIAKSIGNNETNRYIVVANPDGTDPQAIQELGNNADKVQTDWAPNNQIVATAHTGEDIGFDREQVILIGKNHENLPGLVTEGRGLIPNWSPNGSSLLYSVYNSGNGYLPELWVSGGTADTINSSRRPIELNTWANKCSWFNETTLYCAVPSSLEQGAALQPDAVQKGQDNIFRINLKNGDKTNLGPVDGVNEVSQISISTDGKTAYTVNKATGTVNRFDISH